MQISGIISFAAWPI